MAIPWITYTIFIMIAIINDKSIINWILFTTTLILLFWHCSTDLITSKGHNRLIKGWWVFTFIAAICYFIILVYQILCLDPVANTTFIKNIVKKLPGYLIKNSEIIGLVDYTDIDKFKRGLKFLAYVAYFNLSVITRRQLHRSSKIVKLYEKDPDLDGEDSNISNPEKAIEVRFSLVYIVYKFKKIWFILDFFAKHVFTIISIAVMLLCVYWKLSLINSIYILILIIFYALVPFKFQPNKPVIRVENNARLTLDEVKELWSDKSHDITKRLISLKYKTVLILILFTITCMSLLHLSANLQVLRETYDK